MNEIVAVGDCGVDLYAKVPRLAGYDEKVPGDFVGIFGGGVASNFACAAARLGTPTGLISVVGDDEFGRRAVGSVRDLGVDTGGVVTKPEAPTHFCFVCLDERGEKALTIVRTENFSPRWPDLPLAFLDGARLVHIAPFDLEMASRLAAHCASRGIRVSVDLEPGSVGGDLDRVRPLLRNAAILLPNEQCIETLFGNLPVEEAARELLELGAEVVVVTRGEQGSFVLTRHDEARVPAFTVPVKDTTGAGDCFNAAFVSRYLAGQPPVECAEFASAAAALSIGAFGAREGLPSTDEVHGFLRNRGKEAAG